MSERRKVLSSYQRAHVKRMATLVSSVLEQDKASLAIGADRLRLHACAPLRATEDSILTGELRRTALILRFEQDQKDYAETLNTTVCSFVLRLQVMEQLPDCAILDQEAISSLFANLDDVREVENEISKDIETACGKYNSTEDKVVAVAEAFIKAAPELKVLALYVSHFGRSQRILKNLKQSNNEFRKFVRVSELCEGAELIVLLALPCIRYVHYQYLLNELYASYSDVNKIPKALIKAKSALEQVIQEIHDIKNDIEARMKVALIQEKMFKGDLFLTTYSRYFVKRGVLFKMYSKSSFKLKDHQKYMFFLFNDVLIYAQIPTSELDGYKFKHAIPLNGLSLSEAHEVKNGFQIFSSAKTITVFAEDRADRDDWVSVISKSVQKLSSDSAKVPVSDSLEDVIASGRKSLAKYSIRIGDWIQMNLDNGMMYFYELKTAFCSFLPNNVTPKSVPNAVYFQEENVVAKSSNALENCTVLNCLKTAVFTVKDRKYCAIHAPEHIDEDKDDDFSMHRASISFSQKSESQSQNPKVDTPFSTAGFFSKGFPAASSVDLHVRNEKSVSPSLESTMEIIIPEKPTKTPHPPPLSSPIHSPSSSPPPPPPQLWQKIYSDQHKKFYYWCESTNTVTWKKPDSYDGPE